MLTPRCNQNFIPCNPCNDNNFLITIKTYTYDCHIHSFQHKMCIYCFIKKSYIEYDNVKKFPSIIVCYKSCYVHDYT
jgi:hypothetical protein